MKRSLPILAAALALLPVLLTLALGGPALADAAPPLEPPCGDLAPTGETQVQMAAETVLLEVHAPATVRVRAEFTLRNQGTAEERMAVRFPLEDPSGRGDGYGQFPEVEHFAVTARGDALTWRIIEEAFREGDPPITWAAFDVAFPPGQDVQLVVSYETGLTGYGPGIGPASVYYVLETGAGWHGPIGRADLIVRLPYPAGPENVFAGYQAPPDRSFVDGEARWHWEDLEPTHNDNFWLRLVWPEDWQRLVAARGALEAQPGDAPAAVELAEASRIAGSDRKGFVASEELAGLAQATIEQALASQPDAAELHAELAAILLWRLPYSAGTADPGLPRIRSELARALALEPQNARALQVREELEARFGPTPTAAPVADASLAGVSGWVYLVVLPSIAMALMAYIGLRRRRG
ncbi:MAG TPA: hypothetical protein PLJ35_02205 [Anaerolineae bacterium]|nr:hypothetical protein [Anaerolineae bacterium]HOQ97617.1 hypothetical protein [Anaerolineae bacterium]HPL26549.1 hypothetical protein [Anaerolineae bacterium]HPL26560.1 hypothetical protein [Anaerolineae bacterium]